MENVKEKLLVLLRDKIRDSVVANEEQKLFRMDITTKLASLEGYTPEEIDKEFYKYFGVDLKLTELIKIVKSNADIEQVADNLYVSVYELIQCPNIIIAKIKFIEKCIGKYTKTLEKSDRLSELLSELEKETNFWESKNSGSECCSNRSELLSRVWLKDCDEIETLIKDYINSEEDNIIVNKYSSIKNNYTNEDDKPDTNKILLLSDLGELAYVKDGNHGELAIIPKDDSFIEKLSEYTKLKTGNYLYVKNNKMVPGKLLLINEHNGNFTLEHTGFKAVEEYLNKSGFDLSTETVKIAVKTYIKLVLTRYNLYNYPDLAENLAKKVSGVSSPSGALIELKSLIQTELGSLLLEVDDYEN